MEGTEMTLEAVEKVLDEKVRPDLALHGGNIEVEKIAGDVIRVRMRGQCAGCPSAELTLESLVDEELKEAFPQLKQVALVTGVSDDLISQAKALLGKRRSQ